MCWPSVGPGSGWPANSNPHQTLPRLREERTQDSSLVRISTGDLGLAISMRAQSHGGGRQRRLPSWEADGPMLPLPSYCPVAPGDSLAQRTLVCSPPSEVGPRRGGPHTGAPWRNSSKQGLGAPGRPGARACGQQTVLGEPRWIYGPSLPSLPSELLLSNGRAL